MEDYRVGPRWPLFPGAILSYMDLLTDSVLLSNPGAVMNRSKPDMVDFLTLRPILAAHSIGKIY